MADPTRLVGSPAASAGARPQALAGALGQLAAKPEAALSGRPSTPVVTLPSVTVPPPAGPPVAPSAATAARFGNPFAGAEFYVDPAGEAKAAVRQLQASAPADAAALSRLANGSAAAWFGDADPAQLRTRVSGWVAKSRGAGALPVLVAYDIPNRDCGSYSAGGGASPAAYRAWIAAFAAGIGPGGAAVVLEPDALAQTDCLSPADLQTRYGLLRDAVGTLSAAGASVYLDAGNATWRGVADMASRLRAAGVDQARGFALNVSNFDDTAGEIAYGDALVAALGGKPHFVVDTSRNGQGPPPDGTWCNPPGRGLGVAPTTATGAAEADALLWIKVPGESDGTCNGGPGAGQWWLDYALGLARRAA